MSFMIDKFFIFYEIRFSYMMKVKKDLNQRSKFIGKLLRLTCYRNWFSGWK